MMKKLSFILLTIVGVLRPRRVKLTTVVTELIIASVGFTTAVAIGIGRAVIGTASITTRATVRSSDGLRFRYQATRSNGSE
jgi:hypothetical protein